MELAFPGNGYEKIKKGAGTESSGVVDYSDPGDG